MQFSLRSPDRIIDEKAFLHQPLPREIQSDTRLVIILVKLRSSLRSRSKREVGLVCLNLDGSELGSVRKGQGVVFSDEKHGFWYA